MSLLTSSLILNKIDKYYTFYTVHYNIIVKNQQNAQIVYILSIYCTYMFRSLLTIISMLIVTEYSNSTICAFEQDTII